MFTPPPPPPSSPLSPHTSPPPPHTLCAQCCSEDSEQLLCRPVLRGGPSSEPHAAGSHALQPPHQLLQAAVCGEHRHRLLHHVCSHWPGHQRDSVSSGDKEETFLELWQWGFHCAACGVCKQCQVSQSGTAWHSVGFAYSLCSSVRPPEQHSMAWQWLVLLAVCCSEVLNIAPWPDTCIDRYLGSVCAHTIAINPCLLSFSVLFCAKC